MKIGRKILFALALVAALGAAAFAQDTPAAPVEPAKTEMPSTPAAGAAPELNIEEPAAPASIPDRAVDANVFRRTPVIDGSVKDGEWDTYEMATSYQTYIDWDSKHLYFALRSADVPGNFYVVIDAKNDGWYRGDDNYILAFTVEENGTHLKSVRFYKTGDGYSPASMVTSEDHAKLINSVSKKDDGIYTLEISVPVGIFPGFKSFKSGMVMGIDLTKSLRTDGTVERPSECTLVTKKVAGMGNLDLDFAIADDMIARGDTLEAKFVMKNKGDEDAAVSGVVIAGEGLSENFISSRKSVYNSLKSGKKAVESIKSVIPQNMPLGAWAVGAEVLSGDQRLGAGIMSFEVVEPFDLDTVLPVKDVTSDSNEITVKVKVKNYRRSKLYGTAKLVMPEGWECAAAEKKFTVSSKGSAVSVAFKVKPPLGVVGKVPVKFTVTADNVTKEVEGSFNVVAPK